jgi:hypothetical protein
VGGLVRQTVDRAVRQMAEQAGNSQLLESGQVLLAPEVTQIQFRYFDGTTAVDVWDMQEREVMPTAVEVRIWLLPQDLTEEQAAKSSLATQARMYCQTIDLPLAQAAGTTASSSASVEESTEEESSEDETGGTGDTSGTGQDSGSGSGFGVGAPAS